MRTGPPRRTLHHTTGAANGRSMRVRSELKPNARRFITICMRGRGVGVSLPWEGERRLYAAHQLCDRARERGVALPHRHHDV